MTLQLCEDIPSPSQEIWLFTSSPEDGGRVGTNDPAPLALPATPDQALPATPDQAILDPAPPADTGLVSESGFIVQYCTYTPEVRGRPGHYR